MEVFFSNFRQFISPLKLLNYIVDKSYNSNFSQDATRSVLQTLTYWSNNFPGDFQTIEMSEHLESFLQCEQLAEFSFKIRMIRMQLRMCREKADSISEVQNMTINSLCTNPITKLDLLSIPAIEIARQFTLLEFSMFQSVDPLQLVTQESR